MAVNGAAGTLFAWSVLLRPVSTDLDVPTDTLGTVFSLALVGFALAVLLGGRSVDRSGPRRGAAAAGLLSGVGLSVAATAPGPLLLHVGYGVLFGLGSGLAYLSAVTWASARAVGHRPLATSLVVASYAAGPILAAPVGAWAIDRWGWRPTLAAAGLGVALVSLVASRALPGPSPAHRSERASGPRPDGPGLAALWVLFLAAVAPGLLAFAYATEVARERGLSATAAAFVVSLMAAGNLAGRLLAAPLTHWVGVTAALWADLA
ncbi:MAG TPA: MFS transporter, partial [Nocardioidaceae bacterium]